MVTESEKDRILKMMTELKSYKTINEIAEMAACFLDKYEVLDKDVLSEEKVEYIKDVMEKVDYKDFQNSFKEILIADNKKLKEYYPVLRTMLIGRKHGIGVHKMIELIGEDWVKNRIKNFKLF